MKQTATSMVNLWANAMFLPVAFAIDMFNASRPTDDAASGAPEGANVIELEERRKRMEAGND
jgi:hypothetical protein